MHINVDTGICTEFVQCIVQWLRELIVTGVSHTKGRHHTDGVFVARFNHALWIHKQLAVAHRNFA